MNNGIKLDKKKPDLTDLVLIESHLNKLVEKYDVYGLDSLSVQCLRDFILHKEPFALDSWFLDNYYCIYKKHSVLLKNGFAQVLYYGALKYGWNNWDKLEDAYSRYWKAFLRHFNEVLIDKNRLDEESGLLHYYHAYANLHFMMLLAKKKVGYTCGFH